MEYTINKRVNELIEEIGVTPNAFANKLGVKTTQIYNLIKDKNKPSFDLLQKIIEVYNVNADWLLTGRGKMLENTQLNSSINSTINDVVNRKNGQNATDLESLLNNVEAGKINESLLKIANANLLYIEFHLMDIDLNLKLLQEKFNEKPFDRSEYDASIKKITEAFTLMKDTLKSGFASNKGIFTVIEGSDKIIRTMLDNLRAMSKDLYLSNYNK